MKHTKGNWEVYELNRSYHINAGFTHIASLTGVDMPNSKANAKLIAEAGTVANESGFTPRKLLEQRNELLEVLKKIEKELREGNYKGNHVNGMVQVAQEVIQKSN